MGTKNILVIDDDPVLVKLISEMLDILGYKSVTSTTALKVSGSSVMPLMILIWLLQICQCPDEWRYTGSRIFAIRKNIPIILCTGFNEYVSEEEAKSKGICDIVLKPVNMKPFRGSH
jgi:CheY-like chemotaxis protein